MKKVCHVLALTVLVVFVVGASAARADQPSAGQPPPAHGNKPYPFAALDAQLTELDKDHDGRIDHGELRGAVKALIQIDDPRIATVIGSTNGKITRKELKAFVDTDHDSKIDHGEMRRFLISIKQQYPDLYTQIVAQDNPVARKANGGGTNATVHAASNL